MSVQTIEHLLIGIKTILSMDHTVTEVRKYSMFKITDKDGTLKHNLKRDRFKSAAKLDANE